MSYRSTKSYGHELGMSAAFRQWRADSHCNLIHGYALAFTFVFEASELDHRNWVVDFGGLGKLKDELKATFDHKLVVAQDDPQIETLLALRDKGLADVLVMNRVGCEAFAELACGYADAILREMGQWPRVHVVSCEVREHGANSAIFEPINLIDNQGKRTWLMN